MWLLVTYITILSFAPGPVFIKTVQEARNRGIKAGISIASGASIAAILIILAGLIIHSMGFSEILDSSGMLILEQIGAVGIILMGLYAGYQCLAASFSEAEEHSEAAPAGTGLIQGMGMMVPTIPHGLLFYNVIIPQTVELEAVTSTIIGLGVLEVAMLFGFHAIVASVAGRSHSFVRNPRFKKVFDFSLATLLVIMGINILF
ncbi:MAG: LysE family transporter [Chloroflexota bacterium]